MSGGRVAPTKIVEKPINTPWTCAWCHCGDHGVRDYFIDTGLTFDFEGTVYLCNECGKDLRTGAGWLTVEEFEEDVKSLRREIDKLKAEVADYEIIKEFLKSYGLDPVGLKRLTLAPKAAKEELRGRLNPNSAPATIDSIPTGADYSTAGSEPKVNPTDPNDGSDVAANAFKSIFGIG